MWFIILLAIYKWLWFKKKLNLKLKNLMFRTFKLIKQIEEKMCTTGVLNI